MKKTTLLLFLTAALAAALATGGLFNWLNDRQKEAEIQALAALDQGIVLFREKQYEESLEIFQGIPDGLLQDWHLPYYTASALVMQKDFEPAVQKYEEALAVNPNEPLILFALGVAYYKLGKLSLSKSYFAAVLEIDPGNEEAKGLMDIMANLERQQPGQNGEQDSADEGAPESGN
jgi:Flp pilus assembly protein TadD